MITVLPEVAVVDLQELFDRARLDRVEEGDFAALDRAIQDQPSGAVVALDLRKLEYLGYSFAKRTIRRALKRRKVGEYDERQLIVAADQGREFLDGLQTALHEQKLFMLVVPGPESLEKGRLLGAAPAYLEDTFKALLELGEATTSELASSIAQSVQNTKNRLDRLHEVGLLRREKVPSASGGREWKNRVF